MKLFCQCSAEWVPDQEFDLRFRFQSTQYVPLEEIKVCPKCYFILWIEPHYENMMFDLRRMNQC